MDSVRKVMVEGIVETRNVWINDAKLFYGRHTISVDIMIGFKLNPNSVSPITTMVKNPTLGEFYFTIRVRADIKG
ncbi:hypothetical protein HPP92_020553 [Vanilla planifolia]|uniref:Uncharacterized protein n=1 Tax=Vanilla planifolia TaxID=51239 RepID=A0A835UIL3_VANPL|nr:hypothetical protein HPP92_020553 [Vanilla planifolia]